MLSMNKPNIKKKLLKFFLSFNHNISSANKGIEIPKITRSEFNPKKL